MSWRKVAVWLLLGLALVVLPCDTAPAVGHRPRGQHVRPPLSHPQAAAPQVSGSLPGLQRYPTDGAASWHGYGFGVPTYRWGSFGAHYWPSRHKHYGYHGDYLQWSYRRGY
jgi:hypothetical protein